MRYLILALALLPGWAWAENCTFGTDCPSDCWAVSRANPGGAGDDVTISGGPNNGLTAANAGCAAARGGNGIPIRTSAVGGVGKVVFSEDFEAPQLCSIDSTYEADGSPYFGPWYDDTGINDYCGNNSYWSQVYGQVDFGSNGWDNGTSCVNGTCSGTCNNLCAWFPGNPMGCSSTDQRAMCVTDMAQADDLDASMGIPDLIGTNTNISGAFDGNQTLGFIIPPGTVGIATDTGGGLGDKGFVGGAITTVGYSVLLAWSDNIFASDLVGAGFPWKHMEWRPGSEAGSLNADGPWPLGVGGITPCGDTTDDYPLIGCLTLSASTSCGTSCSGATKTKGDCGCLDNNFICFCPLSEYSQPTDWPTGDVGCFQGKVTSINGTGAAMEAWFNGVKVIDITNLNLTIMNADNWSQIFWDTYANVNQELGGEPQTNDWSGRWEDNVVVTDGNPVSCSELGFEDLGGTPPEGDPPGRQFRGIHGSGIHAAVDIPNLLAGLQ